MVRKSKEDTEKTRQAILESALEIFSKKGFAKTTFDEIASSVGFTKGAVYWHFKNKADLVVELIVEYTDIWKDCMPSTEDNTLEGLLDYFVCLAEIGERDENFMKFNRFVICQMEWSKNVINYVDERLKEFKDIHLEKINKVLVECNANGILKDGIDIDKVKHLILSQYIGIMFLCLSKRHNYSAVEMLKTGLGYFFDSLKK